MTSANPWLNRQPASGTPRVRLFCLPYAGGAAQIFRGYSKSMPRGVEVCAVLLPGREKRFSEPAFDNVEPLVSTLASALQGELERPYVIFGHSLGAIVGFELARQLRREGQPQPMRLVVSAHRAPHLPDPDPPIHDLSDEEFLRELRELNGTPAEVFESPELLSLMLPLLRADFSAAETYQYHENAPLECPITVLGSADDPKMELDELDAWAQHTTDGFQRHLFAGDHFFIHQSHAQVLEILCREMEAALVALDRQGRSRC